MRRASALLLLPLLLASPARASVLFRCNHDGVARVEPCCPGEAEGLRQVASSTLLRGCCDAEVARAFAPPAAANRWPQVDPTIDGPVAEFVFGLDPWRDQGPLLASEAPRASASGPPILLLTRSLLI